MTEFVQLKLASGFPTNPEYQRALKLNPFQEKILIHLMSQADSPIHVSAADLIYEFGWQDIVNEATIKRHLHSLANLGYITLIRRKLYFDVVINWSRVEQAIEANLEEANHVYNSYKEGRKESMEWSNRVWDKLTVMKKKPVAIEKEEEVIQEPIIESCSAYEEGLARLFSESRRREEEEPVADAFAGINLDEE